jgi:hypothetical protein
MTALTTALDQMIEQANRKVIRYNHSANMHEGARRAFYTQLVEKTKEELSSMVQIRNNLER